MSTEVKSIVDAINLIDGKQVEVLNLDAAFRMLFRAKLHLNKQLTDYMYSE
jgi:hypothetical protein